MSKRYKGNSEIREEANSVYKEIYLKYTIRDGEIRTEVKLTETVKQLKKKIVNLFELPENFLDNHHLRVKTPGMRNGKVLQDDNKTLEYYHIKNESMVIFGRDQSLGGND